MGACIQRLSVERMSSAMSSSMALSALLLLWNWLAASSRRSSIHGRTSLRKKLSTRESRSSAFLSAKAWGFRCVLSTLRMSCRSDVRMAPSSRALQDRRNKVLLSRASCCRDDDDADDDEGAWL